MKSPILLSALIFVCLLSFANAYIYLTPQNISLERGQGINVNLMVENDLNERVLVELFVEPSSPENISAELSSTSFYLNAFESAELSINVIAFDDATPGDYEVMVKMSYGGKIKKKFINVKVLSECWECEKGVELIAYPKNICLGEEGTVSVLVKNNMNHFARIELFAESDYLLPVIEPSSIVLDPNSSQYVDLILHPINSNEFSESITIFAQGKAFLLQRSVEVNFVECLEAEPKTIDLDIPQSCRYLGKGDFLEIDFLIENLRNEKQTVYLETKSTLHTELSKREIVLDEFETRNLSVWVETSSTTETGRHEIELYAWSTKFDLKEEFCVIVEKEHKLEFSLKENNLKIERCTTGIFELIVENLGDFDEEIEFYAKSVPKETSISFSEEEFVVEKGEKKRVFVSVTPSVDSSLGEKEFEIVLKNREREEKTLKYEVLKEKIKRKSEGFVSISSMPEEVKIEAGKSSLLIFSIKNDSSEDLKNVSVSIKNLPEKLSFGKITIPEIKRNETITVKKDITALSSAESQKVNALLIVENDLFKQSFPLELELVGEEKEEEQAATTGLFALAGGKTGLTILFIVLVVIALILLLTPSTQKIKQKEMWVSTGGKLK